MHDIFVLLTAICILSFLSTLGEAFVKPLSTKKMYNKIDVDYPERAK